MQFSLNKNKSANEIDLDIEISDEVFEISKGEVKTDMDKLRQISNVIARSSWFTISNDNFRRNEGIICVNKDIKFKFDGYNLGQTDFEVFQLICNLWIRNKKPMRLVVSKYQILRCLNRKVGGSGYESIMSSLGKFSKCNIEIDTKEHQFVGALINIKIDKTEELVKFSFNEDLMEIFAIDSMSFYDNEIRDSLKGDLTKWLYTFYCTHAQKQFNTVQQLKYLCNSASEDKLFKFNLKKSLTQLQELNLLSFNIRKDDVIEVLPVKTKLPNRVSQEKVDKPVKPKTVKYPNRGRVAL